MGFVQVIRKEMVKNRDFVYDFRKWIEEVNFYLVVLKYGGVQYKCLILKIKLGSNFVWV